MKELRKPLITADEARRLYEVLCAIDSYPVRDKGSGVHKAYNYVAEIMLMKAGISLGRGEHLMGLLNESRANLLKSYGVSYVNSSQSGVWESLGVDELDVRGALLLGSYLSRSGFDETFEKELECARSYFSEASEIDEDFYTDFVDEYMDYEDEEDRAFDLGANLVVDFIDAIQICMKEGAEQVQETCLEPFYQAICALDGIYDDNPDLFMEHLPGLLIKVAEPYVGFSYQGNVDDEQICGCLGQQYYLIEQAAEIFPFLTADSEDQDVRILLKALQGFMGSLCTYSEYTECLRYYMPYEGDIRISSFSPEGETAMGDEPIPSFLETFAPLLWEALYPVVLNRYQKGDVVYEQAA